MPTSLSSSGRTPICWVGSVNCAAPRGARAAQAPRAAASQADAAASHELRIEFESNAHFITFLIRLTLFRFGALFIRQGRFGQITALALHIGIAGNGGRGDHGRVRRGTFRHRARGQTLGQNQLLGAIDGNAHDAARLIDPSVGSDFLLLRVAIILQLLVRMRLQERSRRNHARRLFRHERRHGRAQRRRFFERVEREAHADQGDEQHNRHPEGEHEQSLGC